MKANINEYKIIAKPKEKSSNKHLFFFQLRLTGLICLIGDRSHWSHLSHVSLSHVSAVSLVESSFSKSLSQAMFKREMR